MPLYEYKCNKCGKKQEFVQSLYEPIEAYTCVAYKCVGGEMQLQISTPGKPNFGFKSFETDNITGKNIKIESRQHKKKLLKKYGLSEAG